MYHHPLIAFREEKRLEMLPTDHLWAINYAVLTAIELINSTFVVFQSRSLLIAKQEQHIKSLLASLIGMFAIEIEETDDEFVLLEAMLIHVDAVVAHIEDQGSLPRQ